MDFTELTKILRERQEQFKKLEDLGIISTEHNNNESVQIYLDTFDERFAGVPFQIVRRDSESHPFELVFEVNGIRFFTLLTESMFRKRFWKGATKMFVSDKDVFSTEAVPCRCSECGAVFSMGTSDVPFMEYCPMCGAKIHKKEYSFTAEGVHLDYQK